ncbi:MAG: mechanosensitive ion channel [Leptolyngbyaceae cyanobacterium CSU_1_3]|nr:mechanosensitive ion channel [Leptolyngbyaceae cyanobacterium CSU_1_3]
MNEIFHSLEHTVRLQSLVWLEPVVAQTTSPIAVFQQTNLINIVFQLLGALAILLIGWLVAVIVAGVVRSLLKKTDLDNRLAGWVSGGRTRNAVNTEQLGATIAFWVVMILAIVASLNALNLTTVSQPLNDFLKQIFAFLPRLGSAAILIGVAWVVASLAKAIAIRTAQSFSVDERIAEQNDTDPMAPSPFLLSETLGNALYWFVFLFFLPLVLGVLDLQGPLQPVQNLLNDILGALPNLLKAVLIAVVGWFVARVVRGIITNLLAATGTDQVGAKLGLSRAGVEQSLSWLIGTIVYVLILIPTATAALDALQIPAISGPATAMLNQILSAIPQIFTAALILVIAYVIGKFVADLVSNILSSVGFDNVFYWLGIQAAPSTPRVSPIDYDTEFQTGETMLQSAETPSTRTPSEIAGVVVMVGILLFATVSATDVLNLPALTLIVAGLLAVFGRLLVGLAVFAVGLYLANLAYSLITSSGSRQSKLLGQTARIAIIALVAAMALQQAGIAPNIVNLAFGLLLGAIAVAIALAFGLGGRDVAADQLRDWVQDFRR